MDIIRILSFEHLFMIVFNSALSSTDSSNLYKNAAANNRPMTDEDFRRIESNLAEEVRRRNYQMQHPQMDPDYHAYGDDFDPTMSKLRNKSFLLLEETDSFYFFKGTTDSMFCSVQAMSTSIDLESSYTSSRPDTLLSPSRNLPHYCYHSRIIKNSFSLFTDNRHRLSASQRKANSQATVEVEHLERSQTLNRLNSNDSHKRFFTFSKQQLCAVCWKMDKPSQQQNFNCNSPLFLYACYIKM